MLVAIAPGVPTSVCEPSDAEPFTYRWRLVESQVKASAVRVRIAAAVVRVLRFEPSADEQTVTVAFPLVASHSTRHARWELLSSFATTVQLWPT